MVFEMPYFLANCIVLLIWMEVKKFEAGRVDSYSRLVLADMKQLQISKLSCSLSKRLPAIDSALQLTQLSSVFL